MNILILTSYFPPDSAISAVRPYMLAKYLSKAGHRVTVIRSGAFNAEPDPAFRYEESFELLSFLGEDSDAERFRRGEYRRPAQKTRKWQKISGPLRGRLASAYHLLLSPVTVCRQLKNARSRFSLQKKLLDRLKERRFDIVFSTYSELENILAGEYAAKLFCAKWIMDFRDGVVRHYGVKSAVWNLCTARFQRRALKKADLCTCVSEGLAEELRACCPTACVETLYNGYEALPAPVPTEEDRNTLRICYTGQVYSYRAQALHAFAECLASLVRGGKADADSLRFVYAGPNSDSVRRVFDSLGIAAILEDHGRITRSQATALQFGSDVFLVLSWNTRASRGVLTGKFYEGIRAGKPILSVLAGNATNSELMLLQARYHYGFCYESCADEPQALSSYLAALCEEKLRHGALSYRPEESFRDAFRYDKLALRLERLMEELLKQS